MEQPGDHECVGIFILESRRDLGRLCEMAPVRIVDIIYTVHQGLSKGRLYKEFVGRKVHNAPEFNLRQNFAFANTPFFFPRVIT